jgi:hypothetical protein
VSELPTYFWAPPSSVDSTESQFLHAELVGRLRNEAEDRGAKTSELILVERVAATYAHLRAKEEGPGFEHERNHKELLALFHTMLQTLMKTEEESNYVAIRNAIFEGLASTINEALADVDPKVASDIRERLADALEHAEF